MSSSLSRRLDALTDAVTPTERGPFTVRFCDSATEAAVSAQIKAERMAARRAGAPIPVFFVVKFADPPTCPEDAA
jgi:hypothetical protein